MSHKKFVVLCSRILYDPAFADRDCVGVVYSADMSLRQMKKKTIQHITETAGIQDVLGTFEIDC